MPRWIWYLINPFQALACFLWTVTSIMTVGVALLFGAQPAMAMRAGKHPWSTVILALVGGRIERHGFPDSGGGARLFVVNHQSVIDIPVLVHVLPAPLFFIAKAELFRLPILGWYMRAVGMVPVDRRAGARGGLDLSQFSRAAETSGVVAFPEGTRSRDGRLGSFKRGAFSAAIAAQIPIVPIAIENAAQVVGRRGMSARPGTIRVHYGREISTVGLDQKDRAGLAEEAREEVARLLGGADADGSSAA